MSSSATARLLAGFCFHVKFALLLAAGQVMAVTLGAAVKELAGRMSIVASNDCALH
jgi:hypothetical protein